MFSIIVVRMARKLKRDEREVTQGAVIRLDTRLRREGMDSVVLQTHRSKDTSSHSVLATDSTKDCVDA